MSHNTVTTTDIGFRFVLASKTLLNPEHRPELQRVIDNAHDSGQITDDEYDQLSRVYFSPTNEDELFNVGYVGSGDVVTTDDIQLITANSIPQETDSDSYLHPALEPTNLVRIDIPDEEYVREHGEIEYTDVEHLRKIQTQIENNKLVWNKAKHGNSSTLEFKTPKTYSESRKMIDDNQMYQEKLERLWEELTNISYMAFISTKIGHQTNALSWDIHPYNVTLISLIDDYHDEEVCKRCGAVGPDEFMALPSDTDVEFQLCNICQ